jgi:hypothetical protein
MHPKSFTQFTPHLFSLRLLRNDAIARRCQAHIIHLDESLAIQTQAVDEGLEVTG